MRKSVLLIVLLVVSLSVSACAHGDPRFTSPRATLRTFFTSAQKTDYSATYRCYDQQYQSTVSETEFISRRGSAAALTAYQIDSLSVSGDSASAEVSLTFAPVGGAESKPRITTVHEDLVRESGGWKIRVQ